MERMNGKKQEGEGKERYFKSCADLFFYHQANLHHSLSFKDSICKFIL